MVAACGRGARLQALPVGVWPAAEKHMKDMSVIHNANVPGWQLQLQQAMNKVFAAMESNSSWYRHNWLFQDYPEVLHPYFKWAQLVVGTAAYPQLPHSPSQWWASKVCRTAAPWPRGTLTARVARSRRSMPAGPLAARRPRRRGARSPPGAVRVRSHSRFALPRLHFIPDLRTD
jgi:hypothetical protein